MLELGHSAIVTAVIVVIELAGVAIIAGGAVITAALFVRNLARGMDREDAFHKFRSGFGRAILLGLEFLVAADIINTIIVELTLGSVASLALIVLIRTFLSWSLELEIEGRWPWQRPGGESRA